MLSSSIGVLFPCFVTLKKLAQWHERLTIWSTTRQAKGQVSNRAWKKLQGGYREEAGRKLLTKWSTTRGKGGARMRAWGKLGGSCHSGISG